MLEQDLEGANSNFFGILVDRQRKREVAATSSISCKRRARPKKLKQSVIVAIKRRANLALLQ